MKVRDRVDARGLSSSAKRAALRAVAVEGHAEFGVGDPTEQESTGDAFREEGAAWASA